MSIGWYPGHMHKARKDITRALQQVDAVIEVVDARLPHASTNPLLNRLLEERPRLRLLNKADLADPEVSAAWLDHFRAQGIRCQLFDKEDQAALRSLLPRLTAGLPELRSRARRLMIVGIPNVGKSTLINLLAGRKLARVGNEPAVTRNAQEVRITDDIVLLDTPGLLWPRLDDQAAAARLAISGAIRNTALELGEIGLAAVALLQERYPAALAERYGVAVGGREPLAMLEDIGRRRGCLVRGGVELTRAAEVVLNDLRAGKLGRISLERPADIPVEAEESASDELPQATDDDGQRGDAAQTQ